MGIKHDKVAPYQTLLLGVSASILLPFFIGAPIMIGALLYLIYQERAYLLEDIKQLGFFLPFIGFTAWVSMMNRNWIGLAVSFALIGFALYFVYYQRYVTQKTYFQIMRLIVVGAGLMGGITLLSYARYIHSNQLDWLYILKSDAPQWRGEGTFFNANYYGMFCVFAMVVDMWLFKLTQNKCLKLVYLISFASCVGGIILTAARMVIPTAALAVIVMLYYLYPKLFKLALLILGVSIALVVIYPSLVPRVSSLFSSLAKRESLWQGGWSIFMSHPLTGRGPMSYLNYYYLYQTEPQLHSHQLLIDSLANYGLIGLFLLVNGFIPYFRSRIGWRSNAQYRLDYAVFLAIVLVVFVHGLVDVSIFWLQTGYVCLAILLPDPSKWAVASKLSDGSN